MSNTILDPDQVIEILKKCVVSKALKYFSIGGVKVPEVLLTQDEDNIIQQLYRNFNISVQDKTFQS